MSDTSRKVFPVESVLALVVGKEGVDVKEIAGFVAGRSVACDTCAKAVGPFAAAWLARWYPKFADLNWVEGQSWEAFVSTGRSMLGDNVSLTCMDGLSQFEIFVVSVLYIVAFNLNIFKRQFTQNFVAHQHSNFIYQFTKGLRRGICTTKNRQFVLN